MKVKAIVAGDRTVTDYEIVRKAIELAITKYDLEILEVVSGGAQGVDTLGEQYADEHNLPIKQFPAKWDNLKAANAVIKVNKWGKKYNVNAGFDRNILMAKYADFLIAVQPNGSTSGTQHMIRVAKENKLPVYEYEKLDSEYECVF